ncbi:MAG: TRAP transporter substrate-binding protein [Planktotalea sp.]|jgi:TRAP-type mannitol/chloroaromatic compound transport system substrate-binding protein|uniref:TRAP transporter substrate-binding protein n=1 Tax=Planktotalea sp. TaxID=2029877 RepID=UPI000183A67F|nr:TRAP transporter substrate-binding protein [Planktotalea sp.]EDZ42107.1 trap dicarboxylate transporter, dctp subunit, putative [Rhodobacteraceae bacterium HTCC2083]MBT5823336.1 TRAP transporter substrate-binding protein [Paracoccaceae bacterium]MDG1076596.1 TRAP transporter substrate-binding protein [Planktotalea sp.]MDG1085356.1 TRAP transporter substrate-binding protein [Planktotalea sp.]HCW85914.1 C4-dicarboxylate ABC transporter substrate-binding protein [Paracoccaceae bacterium]
MKLLKTVASIAVVAAMAATSAVADGHATTKLRIQTHFSPETLSGKMAAKYIEDIQTMSNGEIQVEMFYSSSVVKSVETFDAAATGILDCDMTGSGYQTGKNPAFQFAGDLLGGYLNPYQQMAWLLHGGGRDAVNNLHNGYDMEFVGWWIPGPESLASTKPIRTAADFKDWKFRSPPGLATKVFAALGASPIVMDFNEIFTALETGIIDGADAANLTNNVGLGLYDIAEHTNYPGFHSMPADHLSCNKAVWDAMPAHHQKIMEVAMDSLALHNATINEVQNAQTAKDLRAKGINLYEWAPEDLQAYRDAVQIGWTEFATTPEAKALLESHIGFLKDLGAMK